MRPLLLALAGCGWSHLPDQDTIHLDEPLWDPAGAVATADGLYVRLPHAGALALIPQEGEPELVDIGEGYVSRISASPDGSTVIAFIDRYVCHPDDEREARKVEGVEDCDRRDLEVRTEITVVRDGEALEPQEVDGAYNAVAFSGDGRFAIAYLDLTQGFDVDGVINLTGVVVVDLFSDTSTIVPVGFAADRVLFVDDDGGNAARAVVLSRNMVAAVDLLADPPAVDVTFPLTLDPDTQRDPTGVDLTPDGRYALISTRDSADLYALDLQNESINLVDLSGEPATLKVDPVADRTVLVYGSRPVVEVMEHDFFEVETFDLDEPMNRIEALGGTSLLWSNSGEHDFYRLELGDHELVEYRLQNPAVSVHVAPTEEFAVVLTRPEGGGGTGVDAIYDENPGMEVVDLRDDETEPFLLEGQGLGVAFAADGANLNALVLQEGVDYLFRYDLYARQSEEIELGAPPVSIGTMPDGTFWITHAAGTGLVSFLDPTSGEVVEVAGFASLGLADPIELFEEVQP